METQRRILGGNNNFHAQTPWGGWAAGFISIGFFVFQIIFAGILGLALVLGQFGPTIFEGGLTLTVSDKKLLIDLIIITLVISYIATVGLVVFVAGRRGGSVAEVLSLKRPAGFLINMVLGIVLLMIFFAALSFVMETFFARDAQQTEAQMKQIFALIKDSSLLWGGVGVIVVGAPILEETVFRGFLLNSLSKTRLGFWGGAALSSLLWAAIHGYAASMAVGLFVFGLLLSFMVLRTGSIWISIIMHALWNGAVTIGMFVMMGN